MKKIFKNPIFTFALGLVIAGSIGVYATITASNVTYSDTTVDLALDDLYEQTTEVIQDYQDKFDTLTISFDAQSYNNTTNSIGGFLINQLRDKYVYYRIDSITKTGAGGGTCTLLEYDKANAVGVELQTNTQYTTSPNDRIYVRAKSNATTSSPAECRCLITVTFYN